jgi:threonine dehydrogenase-like Zn-dependent dehydrogenase
MKALALIPGTTKLELIERSEPEIISPDQIKLKVLQVGICGTDRDEASGGRADAPKGQKELVIGHEMLGEVVKTGANVKSAKAGDYGVFMVRRGCEECSACNNDRSDMCYTGRYKERGIKEYDGYDAEYVVDSERYFVKVPAEIRSIAILTEPLSIVEKAITEAVLLQNVRFSDFLKKDWLEGKKALVAGIGTIGLLASLILRLKGVEVLGMDLVDENSVRPELLKKIGGSFIDARKLNPKNLNQACGQIDMILDATGAAKLEFELIDALGINGIYVLTGIPEGERLITIKGASLIKQMVLNNQVLFGSVNAAKKHYEYAIRDLILANQKWPNTIDQIITDRFPPEKFKQALQHSSEKEIKSIIEWSLL